MDDSTRTMFRQIFRVAHDLLCSLVSMLRSRAQLGAANLFLRKQLARCAWNAAWNHGADDATRITLVALSRFLEWRPMPTVVTPETLIWWHRKGFQLFWRRQSRALAGRRFLRSAFRVPSDNL